MAVAFVQTFDAVTAGNSTAATVVVPAGGIPAGHELHIGVVYLGTIQPAAALSDPRGNAYTRRLQQALGSSLVATLAVFDCPVTTPLQAGDVITLTLTNPATQKEIMVAEFSGETGSPFDKSHSSGGDSPGVNLSSGPTANITQALEVVVGFAFSYKLGGGVTLAPGAGYTLIATRGWATASALQLLMEYKLVSAIGAQTATATASGAPNEGGAAVATYLQQTAQTAFVDYIEVIVDYTLVPIVDAGTNAMTLVEGKVHEGVSDSGRNTATGTQKAVEALVDRTDAFGVPPMILVQVGVVVAADYGTNTIHMLTANPSIVVSGGENDFRLVAGGVLQAVVDAGKNSMTLLTLPGFKSDSGRNTMILSQKAAHEARADKGRSSMTLLATSSAKTASGVNVFKLIQVGGTVHIDSGVNVFKIIQAVGVPPPRLAALPAQLGCGVYEIVMYLRGGVQEVGRLPFTHLEWNRTLDDTSEATVEIAGLSGADPECCRVLGLLRGWKHELGIFRDRQRVWCGPLVTPKVSVRDDKATLVARDLSAWLDHRRLHVDHAYALTVDLALIFQEFIEDAMAPDNSPGLVVQAIECQIRGNHSVLAAEHKMAGIEIRSLSAMGIDWTVIDRTVLAGGVVVPTSPLNTLYDEHFVVVPDVTFDGLSQENYSGVRGIGSGSAGDSTYGEAITGSSQAEYGLLETVSSDGIAADNVVCEALATTRQSSLADPVPIIEGGVLSRTAPLNIAQLVPGAEVPLRLQSTCFPVSDDFRLAFVKVTADASPPKEEIQVGIIPLGTKLTKHHRPPRPIVTGG